MWGRWNREMELERQKEYGYLDGWMDSLNRLDLDMDERVDGWHEHRHTHTPDYYVSYIHRSNGSID